MNDLVEYTPDTWPDATEDVTAGASCPATISRSDPDDYLPWLCTRPKGHAGRHEAADSSNHVRATWEGVVETAHGLFEYTDTPYADRPYVTDGSPETGEACRAQGSGPDMLWPWICTRLPGHTGRHEAGGLDMRVCASWDQEE